METSRKWIAGIIVLVVVDLLIVAAFAYLLLKEDEEEEIHEMAMIGIDGSDLATSELVDHGSGTASDPYVITGLDVEIIEATYSMDTYGIMVSGVNDHLIISGSRIHVDYVNPGRQIIGVGVWSSTNVTILDCKFENLTTGMKISHSVVNISYNTIESCRVGVGIERLEYRSVDPGMLISNNSFYNTDYCVTTYGNWGGLTWSGVTISNNSMAYYQRGVGVYGGGHNFTIVGNYFYDGTGFAIDVSKMSESTIAQNRMYGHSSDGGGVVIWDSWDIQVEGNSIETNGPAVCIEWSNDIEISNNFIDSYTGSSAPTQFGVLVENSISINVTYNEIKDRTVGVMILSSGTGNSTVWVHHNEFMWNFVQALDNSGSENHWDDGMSAGNYWDDYDGPDSNHDEIGDSPYLIDNDSWDNFPLVVRPI